MQIDRMGGSQIFFKSDKVEEKENGDRFRVYLDNAKGQEKRLGQPRFDKDDLNLSKVLKDFQSYAINKSIQDKQKQNETTLLTKLFTIIDVNTRNDKV